MRQTLFSTSVITFVLLFFNNSFAQDGEKIFKGNCGICHTVGQGKLVGPDLKGVNTRHNETWLLKWIKSSQAMVKSGDKNAVQLFNDNANLVMPDQALNDDEVKSVLGFIKEKEQSVAVAKKTATDNHASPASTTGHENGSLLSMLGFSGYILILLNGLLLIVIWVMSMWIKKTTVTIIEKNKS